MSLFDELHASGQTIILVTHEDMIASHASRTIRLRDGRVESDVASPVRNPPHGVELAGPAAHDIRSGGAA
jgi:putative ABC transport system ATP-binding protein